MELAVFAPLQWGRVLMNAETCVGGWSLVLSGVASMGPRSHERGNMGGGESGARLGDASMGPRSHERGNPVRPKIRQYLYASLQWGRVLMNAETKEISGLDSVLVGLQWGRVLMNAETATGCGRCWCGTKASMGPRSHERGNRAGRDCRDTGDRLQWGRVLMNAETGQRFPAPCSACCFNGAAFS